jgi:hypothetical protein
MKVFLLIFVVLAALSVVASGIWVAIALIGALSRPRVSDTTQRQPSHSSTREQ